MSNKNNLTYEKAVLKLEEIVNKLEKNDLPLDESIKLFDEGLDLVSFCEKQLQSFDEKLKQIMNEHDIEETDV